MRTFDTLVWPIKLSATGGGPGGGWNAYVEFRPHSRGFSVRANPPDPDDWSGDDEPIRKVGAAPEQLTWRAAASWLLSADDLHANRVGVDPANIHHDGVDDWQGDLLALCWVDAEVDGACPEQRDWLLTLSDQELEELHNRLGSLRSLESLMGIRAVTDFAAEVHLDDATCRRVLLEQAELCRASGGSWADCVDAWIEAQSAVLDEAYEGDRDRVKH